jgi:exodeoxyribonuclease VIII
MAEQKIISDMSNEDYHKKEGISKSTLDLVHKSPALIEWSMNAPTDPSKIEAFNLGTAVHCAILEPDRFDKEYIEAPKVDRRTKAGKQEYAEFIEASIGMCVLSPEDFSRVKYMRESALAYPDFKKMYESGFIAEQSIFWTDPTTEILCKCRPDFSMKDHPVIVDIKTTSDIERFNKSVAEYRYHVQDAHYSAGATSYYGDRPQFLFLAVSSSASGGKYPVRMFELDLEAKTQGMAERNEDLDTIAECKFTGDWPGLETIDLPYWAKREV